jgi:2-octaprenylphenol hydroxylase
MALTDQGWEIHCEGGERFCAPLTVGADGARSKVRSLTAMPSRQWSYEQSAIVGTIALCAPHQDTCWQAFLDTGPLALLPLADEDKAAMVWSLDQVKHESVAALTDEAFLQRLNRALGGDAPEAVAVGPRASFPLMQSHAVDYVEEGLVLVADAAHSIHPLAGQGINLGLSDVRVLALELASAKAHGLEVSSAIALKRYQRQRKTENLAMMAAMEGFKRGFGNANPLAVIARNVGLNLVDQQNVLKRWFMQQALS